MIDYDKLKLAHELNKKNTRYTIRINLYPHTDLCFYALYDLNQAEQIDCKNIDDLINKLKELTQPKPKSFSGWVIDGYGNIEEWHGFTEENLKDCVLAVYPSREALIDAQIAYWIDLRIGLKSEETSTGSQDMSMASSSGYENGGTLINEGSKCEHESDGKYYSLKRNNRRIISHLKECFPFGMITELKCKHCGEFYR